MRERWGSWPVYKPHQVWAVAFWLTFAVLCGAAVGLVAWKLFGE